MREEYLLIGEVVRPQGIKGEIKLKHYTDDPDRFFDLERVFIARENGYAPINVLSARRQKDDVFLTVEGVETRDAAEALRGVKMYIDRAHALPLPEDSVYIADILGASVVISGGGELGRLTDVFPAGGADVYRVKTPKGMAMFPALKRVILSTDIGAGVITVDESALTEVIVYEDSDTDAVPRDVHKRA